MLRLKLKKRYAGSYFNEIKDSRLEISKNFESNLWLAYIEVYSHTNQNGKVYKTIFSVHNAKTKKEACQYIISFIENL